MGAVRGLQGFALPSRFKKETQPNSQKTVTHLKYLTTRMSIVFNSRVELSITLIDFDANFLKVFGNFDSYTQMLFSVYFSDTLIF